MAIDRIAFRNNLLAQGIEWSDDQIDDYITMRESGRNLSQELQNRTPVASQFQTENLLPPGQTGTRPLSIQERANLSQSYNIPQGEKNKAWDVVGNFLWEALDTALIGIPGWLDKEDVLEHALTGEEGPESFAGRVGAGLGGFAGFLVPFGAVKGLATGAVKAGKYGVKGVQKKLATDLESVAVKHLGQKGTGQATWNTLSKTAQAKKIDTFTKPFLDDVLRSSKASTAEARQAFKLGFNKNLKTQVNQRLTALGIRATKENRDKVVEIVSKAVGLTKNSSLPLSTVQQRIALALGGTIGSGKLATMATYAIESALEFAAVETPMEIFQSMDEERQMDLTGRAKHAAMLGGALGIIRFIPGGKQWAEGSMTRASIKQTQRMLSKRRSYDTYDMAIEADANAIKAFALSLWKAGAKGGNGSHLFRNTIKKSGITGPRDIERMMDNPATRGKILEALKKVESTWNTSWGKQFFKEAAQDITGSTGRMIVGSMAFNWELIFRDDIPLEDKVFHTLLGAYMTKQGRVLSYKDYDGKLVDWNTANLKKTSIEYNDTVAWLDALNLNPQDAILNKIANEQDMRRKWHDKVEDTPDLLRLKDILDRNKLVIKDDGMLAKADEKTRAAVGDHPLYEHLQLHFDRILRGEGKKLRDVESLTVKEISKIEKELNETMFDDIYRQNKGITRLTDIDAIMNGASREGNKKLVRLLEDTVEEIYNHLGMKAEGPGAESRRTTDMDGKPILLLRDIIPKQALGQNNQIISELYQKFIKVLGKQRVVKVNQNPTTFLQVTNDNFRGLQEKIDGFDNKLKEMFGFETESEHSRAESLIREEWIGEVVDFQSFVHSVRNSYPFIEVLKGKRIGDDNVWHQFESDKTQGDEALSLVTEYFKGPYGLYKELKLTKRAENNPKLRNFIYGLHEIFSFDMESGAQLLPREKSVSPTLSVAKIRKLYNIFLDNGLTGFLHEDMARHRQFLTEFKAYSNFQSVYGALNRDGKPLTGRQRSQLMIAQDFKLVGPNWQYIDIIGTVLDMEGGLKQASREVVLDSGGKIQGFNKWWSDYQSGKVEINPDLDLKLKNIAKDQGLEYKTLVEGLLTDYKKLMEPLTYDERTGHGFLRYQGDVAQPTEVDLADFVHKLRYMSKIDNRKTNDNILEQLDKMKNNSHLTTPERNKINYLYDIYTDGKFSSTRLVSELAKRKRYDLENEEFIIDKETSTLNQDLMEVIRELNEHIDSNETSQNIERSLDDLYRDPKDSRWSDIDHYNSITKQNFVQRYGHDKDIDIDMRTVDDIIKSSTIVEKDNKKTEYKDMLDRDKRQLYEDLKQVLLNTETTRTVQRFNAIEGFGVQVDGNHKVRDNELYRYLDELIGEGDNTRAWGIGDLSLKSRDKDIGIVDTRENTKKGRAAKLKLESLFDQKDEHILEKGLKREEGMDPKDSHPIMEQRPDGQVIVRIGNNKSTLLFSKHKLHLVGAEFNKKLSEWKEKYTDDASKQLLNKLERVFDNSFRKKYHIKDKDTGRNVEYTLKDLKDRNITDYETIYTWKTPKIREQSHNLQTLFTHLFLDKVIPTKFWDTNRQLEGNKDFEAGAKLLKRYKLITSSDTAELSMPYVDKVIQLHKDYMSADKAALTALRALKRNGGARYIILEDEGEHNTGLETFKKQYDEVSDRAGDFKDSLLGPVEKDGVLSYQNGGDWSRVDGFMPLSASHWNALINLLGAGNIKGLGAIKPIIDKNGQYAIVGKTAFVRDKSYDKFFKRNGLDGIMFESLVKINHDLAGDNVVRDYGTLADLKNLRLRDDQLAKKVLIRPEDIRHNFIVNADHPATITHQSLVGLDAKESSKAYDWLLKDTIEDFLQDTPSYFSESQPFNGLAHAKLLFEGSPNYSHDYYSRWIEQNGFPQSQVMIDKFINQIKSSSLDSKVLKMSVKEGGQSVLAPGLDLMDTIFYYDSKANKNKIFRNGEIELPHTAKDKKIIIKNTFLIERKDDAPDIYVKATNFPEFKTLKDGDTLDKAMKQADTLSKRKKLPEHLHYQVLTAVRRNPHTRPGDIVLVGIKKILHSDYGNVVRINGYDLAMRLEGDFDVDKLDYWWSTPEELINKWDSLSGEVLRVNTDKADKKSSLFRGLDFTDASSVNRYFDSQLEAERLRGQVINTRRLLSYLEHYGSTNKLIDSKKEPINTFSIDISPTEGGGKLYVSRQKLEKAKKLIAEDIQNITDSDLGYNMERYNDKWFDKFLFGEVAEPGQTVRYEGIFKRAFKDEAIKGDFFVPSDLDASHTLNDTEKQIIKAVLTPYRGVLRLATGIFENGTRQKVKYENILSTMKYYDTYMEALPVKVYFKLRKDPLVNKTTLDSYFLKDTKVDAKGRVNTNRNNFTNIFGDFGDRVRPKFLVDKEAEALAHYNNMQPFERAMTMLVRNDKTQMDAPIEMFGKQLHNYQQFYRDSMFEYDFSKTAFKFIEELKQNNTDLGQINYLDYKIKKAYDARREAIGNNNQSLAELLKEGIDHDMQIKTALEKELILSSETFGAEKGLEWARELRDGAENSIRSQIINEKRLPNDWKKMAKSGWEKFKSDADAIDWVTKDRDLGNKSLVKKYIRNKGPLRLKGRMDTHQLELLMWDNMLGKYADIELLDVVFTHKESIDFRKDIEDFKRFYRDEWKGHYDGASWYFDQYQISSVINDKLTKLFYKWDKPEYGAGNLLLWKIMQPKTDPYVFTYFNKRISPHYSKQSLAMIRTGLKFLSNADEQTMLNASDKNQIFRYLTRSYNNMYRAHYGQSGERGTWEANQLSNWSNQRVDIFAGSPLIDDIKGWEPGIQETDLNPQIAATFGYNNHSIAYELAHTALHPREIIPELVNNTWWAYMPTAYIPENVGIMRYPAINGWRAYQNAVLKDARVMLGHVSNQNLLYKRIPKGNNQPFEGIQPRNNVDASWKLKQDLFERLCLKGRG